MNKAAKLDEFFSLIFKSIKADKSVARSIAFIKRLLQQSFMNEVSYTAACMLIISELLKSRDDLKYVWYSASNNKFADTTSTTNKKSNSNNIAADPDDEVFIDIDRLEEK